MQQLSNEIEDDLLPTVSSSSMAPEANRGRPLDPETIRGRQTEVNRGRPNAQRKSHKM